MRTARERNYFFEDRCHKLKVFNRKSMSQKKRKFYTSQFVELYGNFFLKNLADKSILLAIIINFYLLLSLDSHRKRRSMKLLFS